VSRGDRRHHEERVKAKWRRRVRAHPGPTLAAWKAPPPAVEVEAQAVRLAHHNKCDCSLCKRPRYDRRASRGE
jgi:hypothetical protein